jgi:predicted PurR-regulated permease PerM
MEPSAKSLTASSLVRPSAVQRHPLTPDKPTAEIGAGARAPLWGTFLLLLLGAIYFAKDFLLPVVLAALFAMTVRPVVYALERRGLSTPVTAVLIMLVTVAVLAGFLYTVSEPLAQFPASLDSYRQMIEDKIAFLRAPLSRLINLSQEIENMAALANSPRVQVVALEQPGLLFRAMTNVSSFVTSIGVALVIALFFLAAGDLFTAKLIYVLPTFSDKKLALTIVRTTASEISTYLLSITAINLGFGMAVGIGLWLLGISNPILWGALAAIFNYLPYIGVTVLTFVIMIVSILHFDSVYMWFVPPLMIVGLSILEGQFVTPAILSRRLSLNTVSMLLSVVFWGWLWGITGALIAVPLLVVMKVICERVDGLSAIAEFLAGHDPRDREAEEEAIGGTNVRS